MTNDERSAKPLSTGLMERLYSDCYPESEWPELYEAARFTVEALAAAQRQAAAATQLQIRAELERDALRAQLAASQSLKTELATIFGPVKPHHGMTWEASMLALIGAQLAAAQQEAERLREALEWADRCFETLLEAGLIYDCDETTRNRAPIRAALASSPPRQAATPCTCDGQYLDGQCPSCNAKAAPASSGEKNE